ncbi:hypothetical protein [Nocardia coubleae]|uniref:Uncharacterized protein n=1 Tax=Nocardia coubleae TaxID=356147 RepID=A0A846WBC4_9NOCA|nr:hypothetical protein [Nocardia coubleae]NKX89900.1 hypothetical protein [Nocardia coubleae]
MPPARPLTHLTLIFAGALLLSVLAALAFAADAHPECAAIPGDVGPCDYWGRVAEYGPFIILWGTLILAGLGSAIWLVLMAVLGFAALLRPNSGDR